jgi:hypothetical protein
MDDDARLRTKGEKTEKIRRKNKKKPFGKTETARTLA